MPRSSVVVRRASGARRREPARGAAGARFFRSFGRGDVILCLLSGGASSLLAAPRRGVTLAQKRRAVRELARARSADRRAQSSADEALVDQGRAPRKGDGGEARDAVLSDVPGDRASLVGSGPTVRGRRGRSRARRRLQPLRARRRGARGAASRARRRARAAAARGRGGGAGRRLARRARGAAPGRVGLLGGRRDDRRARGRPRRRPRRTDASSSPCRPRSELEGDRCDLAAGRGLGRPGRQLGSGRSLRRRYDAARACGARGSIPAPPRRGTTRDGSSRRSGISS